MSGPVSSTAGVSARDRVFALVHASDDGLVLGMVKLAPGPVVYRRRNGVWARDRALSVQMRARRRRPLLREIRRRDLIAAEVSRWDEEEARRAAAASGMYGEESERSSSSTRLAALGARRIARAVRADELEAQEEVLLSEVMAERRRSAALMVSPIMASAARLTGESQRAAEGVRLQRARESRVRVSELASAVRSGCRW